MKQYSLGIMTGIAIAFAILTSYFTYQISQQVKSQATVLGQVVSYLNSQVQTSQSVNSVKK